MQPIDGTARRTWLKSGCASFCASLMLLSACAVGEDYIPAVPPVEAQWEVPHASSDAITTIRGAWWEQFNDPMLTQLITTATARNNDLKVAAARIDEARAAQAAAYSAFFPQVSATGSGKRGTLGGSFENQPDNSWQAGVNGAWDIDIFGGNRRRDEAAAAATEATMAEAAQTRLQLVEEVARNYVRLRGLQQQMLLTEKNIKLQEQTLTITRAQYKERVVTRLDVLRAQAQMKRTQTRVPQIRQETDAVLNRLAVLLDDTVTHLRAQLPPTPLPTIPAAMVADTPLETMRARPDVAIAERRLAQATALSGAAFAEFFPKLSLDGFFGRSGSDQFGTLNPWSVAANAAFPVLNFGRIQAQVDSADARQKQAYYSFRQTVLAAVADVEVAFSAYRHERDRKQTLVQIAKEQAEAVLVAKTQYTNGLVPQLDLLDAEQNLLEADTSVVQSEVAALENTITLYTALGKTDGTVTDGQLPAHGLISLP
ncbi:MAG: efflux transporter outer membrane subunit [Pseudomonadota bacterium]